MRITVTEKCVEKKGKEGRENEDKWEKGWIRRWMDEKEDWWVGG